MSLLAKNRSGVPAELRDVYAPVRAELDQVEDLLLRELSSRFPFVDELIKHGFRLGGKRMRPALVLLSGRASGALRGEHVVLAAVVEMIHTATLIHDDVLDEATLRRHLETVNARWDNEASVLLGDYLFTHAICLAARLDDAYACRAIGDASRTMCEGELRQVEGRGHYGLAEGEYLDIIAEKTAALCECCCRMGAYYAGAGRAEQDALARYGTDLGVAFQITDDLLDVLGDEAKAGKSLGTDLEKAKPTLPLIHLLNQAVPPDREEILRLLERSDNHRRQALAGWFTRYDSVAYSREKAAWYVARAKTHLEALPSGDARDALAALADFVIARQQ